MININELDSKRVFFYFEEISKIPRGSYNEKEISEYLCEFAKENALEYTSDDLYNVVIKKQGTKGYEDAPVVALQGHTDMVCEKNKGVEHDFTKDPIKLIYDGDFLTADKTTLGADNGVAVAMALAVLESKDINHPPIEAIFTSCEEVGMDGAMALDTKNLKSEMFINIDSEDEGIFTVGCAGGSKADIEIPITYENTLNPIDIDTTENYTLGICGLMGGHSGIDIIKGRANSNILLARLLDKLLDYVKVCSICGGSKDNAIPREAEATILVKKDEINEVMNIIRNMEIIYIDEYSNTDPNLKITFEKTSENTETFSIKSIESVITAILTLPNGIRSMSSDVDGLVESSMNVGVVNTVDDIVEITASVRSAVSSKKIFIMQQAELVIKMIGGKVEFRGDYPAWEYNKNSKLRDKCLSVYKELSGEDAKIEIIHAGLECGLFYEKMPKLDIISFGPNLYDIHTPDEKASISSIDRSWKFLLSLLESIKKEK